MRTCPRLHRGLLPRPTGGPTSTAKGACVERPITCMSWPALPCFNECMHTCLLACRWTELRDAREMDSYSMSIASDPSQRRQRIPGDLARR